MKRAWTREEKWLWATPLLLGVVAAGLTVVPGVARRALGWPESLMTASGTHIRSMALSRNGDTLAAAGSMHTQTGWKRGSGTVYLWNARTAKQLTTIAPVYNRDSKGFTDGFDIYALTLSPAAKQIGFARAVENWALYDVATQKQLWRFSSFISDAEFSRDGRFIALFGDSHISIVSARDGQVRAKWKGGGPTNSQDLAWSPSGTLVASIGPYQADSPIELHRADNGKIVRRIKEAQTISGETVGSVAFSPDSKRLIIAASVGNYSSTDNFSVFAPVRCYDASTGKLLWEVKAPAFGGADGSHSSFCDAIFSPDGRVVAAYQYNEGKVFLLDSATGAIKTTLQLGRAERTNFYVPPGLAFSPNGKRLFARGKEAVLFWDLG
jgi:WD40 repeat protein